MLKTENLIPKLNIFLYTALFIIIIFGLTISLSVVFDVYSVESDFSDSAILWLGYQESGLQFLTHWIYTSDNWLLSLIPFHFLLFWLFGAKPIVVLLSGWLIFITNLFTISLIAWQLNAKRTAILLPIVFLFCNHYAHADAFISYSITHNITNIYGLAAVLFAIRFLQGYKTSLLWLFVFLIIGGVSDPWALGAYLYPMLLMALIFRFIYRKYMIAKSYQSLFLICLLSLIIIKTKFLLLLHFLPAYNFKICTLAQMNTNFYYFVTNLGELINFIPLPLNSLIISILSISFLSYLLIDILFNVKNLRKSNQDYQFLVSVIFLSMLAIITGFLLSDYPKSTLSARYFINIFFLAPLLISTTLESHWFRCETPFKMIAITIACLSISNGIMTNFSSLKKNSFKVNTVNLSTFIDFLEKNNLTYGYGPYWGAQALAVTWLTQQHIKIFPVLFDKTTGFITSGNRPQSSNQWQLNREQQRFFIYIENDQEQCANLQICLQGVKKQFGAPNQILTYKKATIYVYTK